MGIVQTGDIIRVSAKQLGPDRQAIVNTFQYKAVPYGGSVDDSYVIAALVDHIDAMFYELRSAITNQQDADEIDVYNITQDRPMGTESWGTYTGGTGTGDYLPPGVAALITMGTAGKRVKPKKYLGTLLEIHQQNGEWTSTLLALLAAFAGSYIETVLDGMDGSLIPGVGSSVWQVFYPALAATVKSVASYQRRRKPGVGR